MDIPSLRILDANANRATEGLRVVEEYVRFVLDDAALAARYKTLRHQLAAVLATLAPSELWQARETTRDVGTQIQAADEYHRRDVWEVALANQRRAEQSLRSLEEFGKLHSVEFAQAIETMRYEAYTLARLLGGDIWRNEKLAAAKLYLLVDGQASSDDLAAVVTPVLAAGVDIVQLRDKTLKDRELLSRARTLRAITRGKCLFIVNDRPDIAALADADGVHVGQDELTVKDARTIVGVHKLIGVSTHTLAQAEAAVNDGADYLGCGPTFPSHTKQFTDFPGIDFLREVAGKIHLPAFAISGITQQTLPEVLRAGFRRIAVSGAVLNALDPASAASALRAALEAATPSL